MERGPVGSGPGRVAGGCCSAAWRLCCVEYGSICLHLVEVAQALGRASAAEHRHELAIRVEERDHKGPRLRIALIVHGLDDSGRVVGRVEVLNRGLGIRHQAFPSDELDRIFALRPRLAAELDKAAGAAGEADEHGLLRLVLRHDKIGRVDGFGAAQPMAGCHKCSAVAEGCTEAATVAELRWSRETVALGVLGLQYGVALRPVTRATRAARGISAHHPSFGLALCGAQGECWGCGCDRRLTSECPARKDSLSLRARRSSDVCGHCRSGETSCFTRVTSPLATRLATAS